MSEQQGSALPGVVWLGTMWVISEKTPLPYSEHAFFGSLALMGVWYLALHLFGRARLRPNW